MLTDIVSFFQELKEQGYEKAEEILQLLESGNLSQACQKVSSLAYQEADNNLANQFFLVADDLEALCAT